MEKINKKKKVVVLGSSGMIGHVIYKFLKKSKKYEIFNLSGSRKVDQSTKIHDVRDFNYLENYLESINPDYVINCIGVLINESNKNIDKAIFLNALFPHLLKNLSYHLNYKLIHISTDCVYSGKKGDSYIESDYKDGKDNYSKTKGLGEVIDDKNLTFRTSVVGPELKSDGEELFHWFISQNNQINGFTNVFWSGITTIQLAKAIIWSLDKKIVGLYNLTNGEKISKNDLLKLFKHHTNKKINIKPIKTNFLDKSFIDTRKELGYNIPSYNNMISELAEWINKNSHLYPHYF